MDMPKDPRGRCVYTNAQLEIAQSIVEVLADLHRHDGDLAASRAEVEEVLGLLGA